MNGLIFLPKSARFISFPWFEQLNMQALYMKIRLLKMSIQFFISLRHLTKKILRSLVKGLALI